MSRWIDTFNNHSFKEEWQRVKDLSAQAVISDVTEKSSVKELARLKKVITYIDKLLKACDPELMPENFWDDFQVHANVVADQIQNFNQEKNIQSLTDANNLLDYFLSSISPYVVSGKNAAQAAGKAFRTYSDVVNEQKKVVSSTAQKAVEETQKYKEQSAKLYESIAVSQKNIQSLEKTFFEGSEDKKSLQDETDDLINEITDKYSEIKNYYKELTTGDEEKGSIILQIKEAKDKAFENAEEIKKQKVSSEQVVSRLKFFHTDIFGKKNDKGELEGGLEQEIEKRKKELVSLIAKQETTYDELCAKINDLLPGATSAGLASAYKESKEKFEEPIKSYSRLFYISLGLLFVIAGTLVIDKIGLWFINFADAGDPIKLLTSLIYRLPIVSPVLWLAIFSTKRRSEVQRLEQEYAHKEVVTKSYEGFKKQIDGLNTKDDALMKQLLETAIESIAFNASNTLDKKHGDKLPIQEIIKSDIDKVQEKKG